MSKSNPKNPTNLPSSDSRGVSHPVGGKVVHDSRGNAVWDWAIATGVLAGKKAADLLNLLEDPQLALEGELEVVHGWGGDPYNRG